MRNGKLEALIKGAVGVLSETNGADRLPSALIHFRQDRQPDVSVSTRLIAASSTWAVGAHHKTTCTAHAPSWWRCRSWSGSAGSTIHPSHLYISNCRGKRKKTKFNQLYSLTLRRVPLQFLWSKLEWKKKKKRVAISGTFQPLGIIKKSGKRDLCNLMERGTPHHQFRLLYSESINLVSFHIYIPSERKAASW